MRATFHLTFSGKPAQTEQASAQLADLLTDQGHFFDEDFTTLHGRGFRVTGLELRTEAAIRTALDALPRVGASLIQTHCEQHHTHTTEG